MKTTITDGLLYQYLRSELSEEQAVQITGMITKDVELAQRLESIRWIDDNAQPVVATEPVWDKKAGWSAITAAIEETPVVPLKTTRSSTSFFKIAASFAVLLVSAWLVWSYTTGPIGLDNVYAAQKLNDQHELPDGTVVWLDAGASVKYSDEGRQVELTGKGYFDVARDEATPFLLGLERGTIEVLGTQFNVDQDEETIVVSVTEGRVRFSSNEEETILAAGQRAELLKSTQAISSIKAIDHRDLLWHEQVWSYDKTSLSQVLTDINSTFNTTVVLSNQDLSSCLFSTSSTEAGLSELLDILRRVYEFNIETSTSGYILQGGVCNN